VAGRALVPLGADNQPAHEARVIDRARAYHRHWLLAFRDVADRTELERWPRGSLLGAVQRELPPPPPGQVQAHEVPGMAVVVGADRVGVAREIYPTSAGELLAVEVAGEERLVPFRKPFLVSVDREARVIRLELPPGLLEL
jgi:ribosomal 30S subunit maturation factor RimM